MKMPWRSDFDEKEGISFLFICPEANTYGAFTPELINRWFYHMTSSPPCWWTKTKDLSLAPFVRPPEIVHCCIVIRIYRAWLQTTYSNEWIANVSIFLNSPRGIVVRKRPGGVMQHECWISYSTTFHSDATPQHNVALLLGAPQIDRRTQLKSR